MRVGMRGMRSLLAVAGMVFAANAQTFQIQSADPVDFPALVDSNSPAYWSGDKLYLYNSLDLPIRSESLDNVSFIRARAVFVQGANNWRWIEAVWKDANGTVYAWYHAEPVNVCPGQALTAPEIGALVSTDGVNFQDLGIVLQSGDPPECSTSNRYFAGGNGDFSVIPDRQGNYFYFLFTNYGGAVESQGIAMARMAYGDIASPVGKVWKFYNGDWNEAGLGGHVTPVFAARASWSSDAPDSFWGPAVHWNATLGQYVVLMNHAADRLWNQEGIYISSCPDIANPAGWTPATKLMDASGWYPQVLSETVGETDTVVSGNARLYIMGHSEWELVFTAADSADPSSSNTADSQTRKPGFKHSVTPTAVTGGRFAARSAQ